MQLSDIARRFAGDHGSKMRVISLKSARLALNQVGFQIVFDQSAEPRPPSSEPWPTIAPIVSRAIPIACIMLAAVRRKS